MTLFDRFNPEYFHMFGEIPLMLKLRLSRKHSHHFKDVSRLLIVNNGLIGEFMAFVPALKHLLAETHAAVDLLVSPPMAPLLQKMIGIHEVFTQPSVYRRDTEPSHGAPSHNDSYDGVIVIQLSGASYQVLKSINYQHISITLGKYLKYLLYLLRNLHEKKNLTQLEEVLFDMLAVKQTRLIQFDEVFRFNSTDYQSIEAFPFIQDRSSKKIIIHTGSGWRFKHWDNQRWVELLKELRCLGNFQFIFIGGTEKEAADFHYIREHLAFEIFSLIKEVNLCQLALIIKHSHYFIGVDSGPRHLAHMLNLPSICLLGPGPKIYNPTHRNAFIIDHSACYCTNLFCYKKQSCMDKITVHDVLTIFQNLLS